MADRPAPDEPQPGLRRPVLAGAAAFVAIAALLSFQDLAWWLLTSLIPYPFFALVGAALIAWIAALLRRAPSGLDVGPRLARAYWALRLAFLVAHAILLAAWAVAALAGAPVAPALLDAFLIALVLSAMISVAIQCLIDVIRALRGRERAES